MMTDSISFPNLGITLSHVGKEISLFGFPIAYYGIVLAAAMVAGICLVLRTAEKTGQNPDDYFDLALIALAVSILCARVYYVIFSWEYYRENPLEILNIRGGGLAIYGGVIGGAVTCAVFGKRKKKKITQLLDTACLGLVLGQAIGRWGNFFNREAFGDYTDGLLAMRIPAASVRASEITETLRAHQIVENGIVYIQVHPTFLYESLWNLGVLAVLLVLTRKKMQKFQGEIFLFYLLLYGAGRFWIEGLRTDQLLWPGLGIPVSQILSGILVIVSSVLILILRKKAGKEIMDGKENRGRK